MIREANQNPGCWEGGIDEIPSSASVEQRRRETAARTSRVAKRWSGFLVAVALLVESGLAQDSSGKPATGRQTGRLEQLGLDSGGTSSVRRVPDTLKFAHGLLRQRKFELAAEEYNRFLRTGPKGLDRIDALFGLGNARLYQAKYGEARRAFEEFLNAAPDDSRALTARYRLGELAYLMGDLSAARRALETFTATKVDHPGLETAWTYLGDISFGLKDLAAAKIAYERSLSKFPRGRLANRARYGLGRALEGLGDHDRALSLFQGLAHDGGLEWVDRSWLQIGAIHQSTGQFAEVVEAMSALERAVPASNLKHEAWLRRAQALRRLGRSVEAETLLKKLTGIPEETLGVQAALELSTIELEQNRPEAALATLDAAAKKSPKSPLQSALRFRSAEALRKLKRLAEAEELFLKVVDSDPDDAWADDALQRAALTATRTGRCPNGTRARKPFSLSVSSKPTRRRCPADRGSSRSDDGRPSRGVNHSRIARQPSSGLEKRHDAFTFCGGGARRQI